MASSSRRPLKMISCPHSYLWESQSVLTAYHKLTHSHSHTLACQQQKCRTLNNSSQRTPADRGVELNSALPPVSAGSTVRSPLLWASRDLFGRWLADLRISCRPGLRLQKQNKGKKRCRITLREYEKKQPLPQSTLLCTDSDLETIFEIVLYFKKKVKNTLFWLAESVGGIFWCHPSPALWRSVFQDLNNK